MDKSKTVGNTRISGLFDSGTFVETNAYLKRKGDDAEYEGVISGYGAINGRLTFAFVQDSDRMKGAFDALAAKKIAALYAAAVKNGAPVIGVFDSAGAVITEGSEVLSAYGTLLKCVADASGVIPQIALVSGSCTGMSAVAAAMFDIAVTVEQNAQVSYQPAFTVGKASTEDALAYVSDIKAKDEAAAFSAVRQLIDLLPSNNAEGVMCEDALDDSNRQVVVSDAISAIGVLADAGTAIVLDGDCKDGVETALTRIGGVTVGMIAFADLLNSCAAKKAAWFMNFCDSFSIPIITLIDSEGVSQDVEDNASLATALASLASVYASSTSPKISVVTGKAYGAAFTLAASKTMGADLAFALKGAEISPMSPAKAVAFLCNDQVTADKSRDQVEAEWKLANASAEVAAANGDIDDILTPSELRQRLCAAVYMLMKKANGTPSRKHGNLPL